MVKIGEKVHVILRRSFEAEIRRHFAGTIVGSNDVAIRVQGFVYVFNPNLNTYVRRVDQRERIVSMVDANTIINFIPNTIEIEQLLYKLNSEGRLVLTDNKAFSMDINEFGPNL